MNRIQKQSWITVISIGIAFIGSCMVVVYWAATKGFPFAWNGFLFISFGILGYIGGVFVKKDSPAIVDERDRAIKALAKNNAFIASYMFFILLSMGIWFYHGPDTRINVNILPICCGLAPVVFVFFESLTYLIAYRKGGKLE